MDLAEATQNEKKTKKTKKQKNKKNKTKHKTDSQEQGLRKNLRSNILRSHYKKP